MTAHVFLSVPCFAEPDKPKGGRKDDPNDERIEEERLDNKGTVGKASEPSERNRSTLREENFDPTFGSEGSIGQSIGSGQKKGPSSGLGPKQDEE